jgi:hypothetical protein
MKGASLSHKTLTTIVCALAFAACGRTAPYWYTPDGGFIEPVVTEQQKPPPPVVTNPPDDPFEVCDLHELVEHPLPPANRKPIDVLFMIDDSPSMADDQNILADNFKSFIESFQNFQVDFQIGAVTSDMTKTDRKGQLVAPFLTPNTPNLNDEFKKMVNVGDKGSAKEQGIAASMAAVSEPLISTSNAGFLRTDADFALIILTDENDSSPQTAQEAIDFFKALKNDPEAITVAAILDFGGSLFCGLGASNWKYAQLVNAFGSHGVLSVCNSGYSKTLDTIGGRIVRSRCIISLKRAITNFNKVKVTINGMLLPYVYHEPDELYPNGSIELALCPAEGGMLSIDYYDCP